MRKSKKKNLRELRFERQLTQLDLYLKCGVSPSRISMLETGKYVPTDEEKAKLAESIGVAVDDVHWPRLERAV